MRDFTDYELWVVRQAEGIVRMLQEAAQIAQATIPPLGKTCSRRELELYREIIDARRAAIEARDRLGQAIDLYRTPAMAGPFPRKEEHAMGETVRYSIGVDSPITPQEPLPALPEIPRGALVVVEGWAPIWRYAMALHRLHGSPAGAIAVYDPRLGAVVVQSHTPAYAEGDVLDFPEDRAQ